MLGFGSGAAVHCFVLCTVGIAPENEVHTGIKTTNYLSVMCMVLSFLKIVRQQMWEMMKSLGGLGSLARKWKSLETEMTAQLRNKNPTKRIIHPCGAVRCW